MLDMLEVSSSTKNREQLIEELRQLSNDKDRINERVKEIRTLLWEDKIFEANVMFTRLVARDFPNKQVVESKFDRVDESGYWFLFRFKDDIVRRYKIEHDLI